ncbi:DUF2798 domain-containing protein [Spirochaeta cellobiosiphila]|uniref:DUF2798 domain-containing protein n=1 Tax=Spirochaeta cellobiosiphila TaxID=504483 RepID=UPI00041DAA31|nr:DUF2798 domain-containing protein [Spirochaeta cellobiosiphila]
MPINKRESLIFTSLMCAFMVFTMSIYNIGMATGYSLETISHAWLGFPLAYIIAFILDWFIVSIFAKGLAFKIASKVDDRKKKIVLMLLISTLMVVGMCFFMSLFGAVQNVGFSNRTVAVWLGNIPKNFIVALPLQIIIAGPIIRFSFRKLFPVGCIN